jgi:organic radical activating enzyme
MASAPVGTIGNLRENTMEEIWNDDPMRKIRRNMLNEKTSVACGRCYEQENSGFFTMRYSANKRFGHHIDRIKATQEDGTVEEMVLSYWDIRFSNLCNLRCRSCGHIFSSNWYDDQASLIEDERGKGWGKIWKDKNPRINYAGRTQTDAWEQLEPHLDHVEHIYFAGGEPLIMEEHYRILNELLKRGKNKVRLIYNTNFTELRYKKQNVLELWNQFSNVCVGASLDDMGPRAEYMRKGTDWSQIERNRENMMRISPNVDFYISPTLSIMNARSLVNFHRDWVAKGFLTPSALNVNILQDPQWYRLDVLPAHYKKEIEQLYLDHIEWLRPVDDLKRAITGFESAINFMNANDKSNLLPKARSKFEQMDAIRGEDVFSVIPELKGIL